jgi:hypothetical protein
VDAARYEYRFVKTPLISLLKYSTTAPNIRMPQNTKLELGIAPPTNATTSAMEHRTFISFVEGIYKKVRPIIIISWAARK